MAKNERLNMASKKLIAILVASGVALSAATFGAGYLIGAKGHSQLVQELAEQREEGERQLSHQRDDLTEAHAGQIAKLDSRVSRLKTAVAREGERTQKLEARRALGRVLLAMDDRNFGIAQGFAEDALRGLDPITTSKSYARLRSQVQGTKVTVAGDLQTQRAQYRAFVTEMDELLDAELTED